MIHYRVPLWAVWFCASLFAHFSSSPSPLLPRTILVPLFPDLHHLLALHPLQLVGAADTCRASASATDGKRRGRERKREERIKESKGLNKKSVLKRARERRRERERGRKGKVGGWNRREGVARCERARGRRDGEDSNGASGPAGVGEHSGVNRVQPQLGSLQPGPLRVSLRLARSRVFGCENSRCRIGRLPITDVSARFFGIIIFFLFSSFQYCDDISNYIKSEDKICIYHPINDPFSHWLFINSWHFLHVFRLARCSIRDDCKTGARTFCQENTARCITLIASTIRNVCLMHIFDICAMLLINFILLTYKSCLC